MIKTIKILWIFYLKLLIPSLLFSVLLAFQTGFSMSSFGFCFLVMLPAFHFLIYELRLKREYLFFANFGFSKQSLWIMTICIGLAINGISKLL